MLTLIDTTVIVLLAIVAADALVALLQEIIVDYLQQRRK